MAVVPTPWTMGSTAVVPAASYNAGARDVMAFLLARPMAELVQAVSQSPATAVWTSITFDSEQLDSDPTGGTGGHDNAVNNSRFTAVYPGWYVFGGGVSFAANVTGLRGARWLYNGSVVTGGEILIATTPTTGVIVPARIKRIYLSPGDYVELQGFQNSGGALATSVAAETQSSMTVAWERNA
jgi:hypothetical protein